MSSVSLGLGEEVLARVRHAGPPVLLELLSEGRADAPRGREGGYAVVRGSPGGGSAGVPAAPAPPLFEALTRLVASLPQPQRELFAKILHAGGQAPAAPPRPMIESLAQSLLAADPELRRIDGWITALDGASDDPGRLAETLSRAAKELSGAERDLLARSFPSGGAGLDAARLRAFLAAREERAIAERPWSGPLREVTRILETGAPPGSGDLVPFSSASGHGVLRVFARPQGEGRKAPSGGQGPVRVGILLEMSRLGPVGAAVAGSPDGRSLDVIVSADRDGSRARLRAGLGELKSALEAAGWNAPVLSVAEPERRAAEAIFGEGERTEGSIDVVA